MPVPRPMEDRMPRPTHQITYRNQTSARATSAACCPAPDTRPPPDASVALHHGLF